MKKGTEYTTTDHIRNYKIGDTYMHNVCEDYCDGLIDSSILYNAWCSYIDAALEGTGFYHQPGTSEVIGPIDGEITEDEFKSIMDEAFNKAVKYISEDE